MPVSIPPSHGVTWAKVPRQMILDALQNTPNTMGANLWKWTKNELVRGCQQIMEESPKRNGQLRQAFTFVYGSYWRAKMGVEGYRAFAWMDGSGG